VVDGTVGVESSVGDEEGGGLDGKLGRGGELYGGREAPVVGRDSEEGG
jgi:hypothetical protein